MGIFQFLNRLLGKRAPAPEAREGTRTNRPRLLKKPKIVGQPSPDSPFLLVQNEGGAVMMMDREMFDYVCGELPGADPAQRHLDVLLPRITRARAVAGGMFRGKAMGAEVVLETTAPEALGALRAALRIVEDPATFTHCGCLGGPTLELYAGPELLATIGLQHGHSVRWARWKHDARLCDGRALNDWLVRYGLEKAFLDVLFHNQYDAGGMMPVGFQRAGPAPLSRAEQRLRLADLKRTRGGDLEAALAECNQVLEAEPDLAFGYAVRALLHQRRGDHGACVADCTEAVRRGLREAELFFVRAVSADHLGRPHEALADCTAALEVDPKHVNALNSRGLIYGRLGRHEEAVGDLSEAIRLAPQWFLPYLHRGQSHYARGRLEEALADYDRAICLLGEGRPAPPASEAGPLVVLAHCRRGEARYDLFREEEAEADFEEARRRNPAEATAYLGDMWLRRGKFGRAVEAFSRLVQLRPKDARGYTRRGVAREALGELEEAAADYSAAIGLQEGGPAYALRAVVRQRQGRPDEALADITEHLRLHPDDARGYLLRAGLHKQRGALSEALADLNAAHRAAPDDPLACNNLAWFLATCPDDRLRDGGRAVALARQACQATDWKQPFCLGTLGAACAETGAFDEAIRWQTQALALYPEGEKPAGQARLALYQAGQPYRE